MELIQQVANKDLPTTPFDDVVEGGRVYRAWSGSTRPRSISEITMNETPSIEKDNHRVSSEPQLNFYHQHCPNHFPGDIARTTERGRPGTMVSATTPICALSLKYGRILKSTS